MIEKSALLDKDGKRRDVFVKAESEAPTDDQPKEESKAGSPDSKTETPNEKKDGDS